MLFFRGNSQIIDTAEGNLSVGQFLGIDTDSGIIFTAAYLPKFKIPREHLWLAT